MHPVLTLDNITKSYVRDTPVLKGLSLQVNEGEVYGFLGNNGSGKTTTIKAILGLVNLDSGSINLFGEPSTRSHKSRMGFAQESTAFYSHLTAIETLRFHAELLELSESDSKSSIEENLRRVQLFDRKDDLVKTFSKGMRQRLGLASALVHQPDLIILDEPATGLDPFGRELIKEIISGLQQEGRTVFFSSHYLTDVERVCSRFGILVNGVLKAEMTPAELAETRNPEGELYSGLEEYFRDLQQQEEKRDE